MVEKKIKFMSSGQLMNFCKVCQKMKSARKFAIFLKDSEKNSFLLVAMKKKKKIA